MGLIYINKSDSLEDMDKFLETYNLTKDWNRKSGHMAIYPDNSLMFKNAYNLQTLVHKLCIDTF